MEETFKNKPVRGFVMAYYDTDNTTELVPFLDTTFADLTSNYPTIDTALKTYVLPYDPASPPTTYFYGENGGKITMTLKTTWTTP
jgi:hypothetical protein